MIRIAELQGAASVDLGTNYNNLIVHLDVRTAGGLYEACNNYSGMGHEKIQFEISENYHYYAGGAKKYVPFDSESVRELEYIFVFTPWLIMKKEIGAPREVDKKPTPEPDRGGGVSSHNIPTDAPPPNIKTTIPISRDDDYGSGSYADLE